MLSAFGPRPSAISSQLAPPEPSTEENVRSGGWEVNVTLAEGREETTAAWFVCPGKTVAGMSSDSVGGVTWMVTGIWGADESYPSIMVPVTVVGSATQEEVQTSIVVLVLLPPV